MNLRENLLNTKSKESCNLPQGAHTQSHAASARVKHIYWVKNAVPIPNHTQSWRQQATVLLVHWLIHKLKLWIHVWLSYAEHVVEKVAHLQGGNTWRRVKGRAKHIKQDRSERSEKERARSGQSACIQSPPAKMVGNSVFCFSFF